MYMPEIRFTTHRECWTTMSFLLENAWVRCISQHASSLTGTETHLICFTLAYLSLWSSWTCTDYEADYASSFYQLDRMCYKNMWKGVGTEPSPCRTKPMQYSLSCCFLCHPQGVLIKWRWAILLTFFTPPLLPSIPLVGYLSFSCLITVGRN